MLAEIVAGPDGNLWFTGDGCGNGCQFIDSMTTSGALTRYVVPEYAGNLDRGPQGLAFDGSGNLWFTDRINNQILELQPH